MSFLLFLASAVILVVEARTGQRVLVLLGFAGLMQANPWQWELSEDPNGQLSWMTWALVTGAPLTSAWLVVWASVELVRATHPRWAQRQPVVPDPASPWTYTSLRLVSTAILTGIAATCLLLTGDLMTTQPQVLSHAGSAAMLMVIWSVMPVVMGRR